MEASEAVGVTMSVSKEALDLYFASDVIDLHIDTYIWARILRYDLTKRHGTGPFGGRFLGQCDLPRLREAKIGGAIWSITTQPFLPASLRASHLRKNFRRLAEIFSKVPAEAELCRTRSDYDRAKAKGAHAVWIGIQGGNAIGKNFETIDEIGDGLLRVTLVHLSRSNLGNTSSPLAMGTRGLTSFGRDFVKKLNEKRIFVDLAHISREGFFDAVEVHDKSQPLIVTHTGVRGVHAHWRNLDDLQIKAVADTGGTIGIMYHSAFLGDPTFAGKAETIVRHLEHVISVAGEDHASLGSDWDGMIVPPRDLVSCLDLPRLVQIMLDRKWSPERVRKVLGGNFLRTLALLRP